MYRSSSASDTHGSSTRLSKGRRHGFANAGASNETPPDVSRSVLLSGPCREAKDLMLEARDTYLNDHLRARGRWAPTDRRLGLNLDDNKKQLSNGVVAELMPKDFHEHFSDMSAELEGLLIGGPVATKDRVNREATMLANRGGESLDREVETIVRGLRSEVAQRVDNTEVDDWGYIHFPQDIPEKEMRKRIFPYTGGKEGLLAATADLSQLHDEAFDSQVDEVLRELRGETWGVAPGLSTSGSLQGLQQDVEMLKQYVGKLKKPTQTHESFTIQVQKLRKNREQTRRAQELLQRDIQLQGLEDNLRTHFMGRERSAPKHFPKNAFDCLSRNKQDRVIACM